jgi:hypothetical protein
VTRDQRAGILGAGRPLEHRFGEVTGLRGRPDERPEDQPGERRLAETVEGERRDRR